jgi:hypothetical protein
MGIVQLLPRVYKLVWNLYIHHTPFSLSVEPNNLFSSAPAPATTSTLEHNFFKLKNKIATILGYTFLLLGKPHPPARADNF